MPETRMSTMDAGDRKRAREIGDNMDTSEDTPATLAKRCLVDDPHLALVAGQTVVKERAQWRGPKIKEPRGANDAPTVGGVDAATPAWTAEGRSRASGQKSEDEERKLHWGLVMGR